MKFLPGIAPRASGPKYPGARVRVSVDGPDGNAFAIVDAVADAIRAQGAPAAEIWDFRAAAFGGSYRDLLDTCRAWCTFSMKGDGPA